MDIVLSGWQWWVVQIMPTLIFAYLMVGLAYMATTRGSSVPNAWSDKVVKVGLYLIFLPVILAWEVAKLLGNWAWHYLNPPTSKKKKKKGKK